MKNSKPYSALCMDAMKVVEEAGHYLRGRHENREDLNIEVKGRHNFVTEVDKKTEELLVKGLQGVLPEAGFIAEEGTATGRGEKYNWVIDPVDGTTNFIHGVHPFAISVGLVEDDVPVVGIILEIGMDECFYGWKGGGAWLRSKALENHQTGTPGQVLPGDRKMSVSKAPTVELSLVATGFPYTDFSYLEEFMESVSYYMENSQGLRRLGSAASDMAYVACGRFDAFYEYGLHPWDICAGLLLISEAGGISTDFKGASNPVYSEDLVCSNGLIHDEFLSCTQKIMYKK